LICSSVASTPIDASGEEFESNIATTRRVADAAHAVGISVEAELGQLGGVEEHVAVDESNAHLTDPDQAREFVERSGCDSLACAIGTSHGAYKFSGRRACASTSSGHPAQRARRPLVMHGSTGSQEEVAQSCRGVV
jgi:fructose-bisphosphate aldolase class II